MARKQGTSKKTRQDQAVTTKRKSSGAKGDGKGGGGKDDPFPTGPIKERKGKKR
jgi:hypothetical protein